ncbi:MAG TPA: SDR family NAD(P)-dependent oxidoreductase, partial [Myxococcaceae bacterium]|nr:SDR family NAD(P)-dependent oxidoreductase [Myxococcaceae bacterium]
MKQVFITGASRGIGAASAVALGAAGYRVWLHYRTREAAAHEVARSVVAAGGPEPKLVCFDLAKRQETDRATRDLLERYGSPDALVLNAGIARNGLFA